MMIRLKFKSPFGVHFAPLTLSHPLAYKKQYKYTLHGSSATSGIVLSPPRYHYDTRYDTYATLTLGDPCLGAASVCPRVTLYSASKSPLGAVQGSYVGYDRVEEINDGKTVYYYHNQPLGENVADEMDNGRLYQREAYDAAGKLLAKWEYAYTTDNSLGMALHYTAVRVDSEPVQDNKNVLCQTSTGYQWQHFQEPQTGCVRTNTFNSKFKLKSQTVRQLSIVLTQETVTQYFYTAGGAPAGQVAKVRNLQYETTSTRQPTRISYVNSDGTEHITYYRFAGQRVGTDPQAGNMVTANMVGIPLVTEYYVGGIIRYRNRLNYEVLTTGGPGYLFPAKYYDRYQTGSDRLRETVEARDGYGNIIQSRLTDDQPVAYVWSYHGSRLSALVRNATNNAVAFTSCESTLELGGWTLTGSLVHSPIGSKTGRGYLTSGSLSKAVPIGIYRISYWTKTPASVSITGGTVLRTLTSPVDAQGWYQVERTVQVTAATVQLNIAAATDEIRLYPVDALMTTYAYGNDAGTDFLQLVATGDPSGALQRYDYDSYRRLTGVRDFDNNLVRSLSYWYGVDNSWYNLVRDKRPLVAGKTTSTAVDATPIADLQYTKTYVDGLGRPLQGVDIGASPTGQDIVGFHVFDSYGRETRRYLPFADPTNSGNYRSTAATLQQSFYIGWYGAADAAAAWTETTLELSPLRRPLSERLAGAGPGAHPAGIVYRANVANEVRRFESAGAYYAANSLLVTETTDGDGRLHKVYTDKAGRRVMEDRGGSRTYYAYDAVGNVTQVVPPEAAHLGYQTTSNTLTSTPVLNNSYIYTYNSTTNLLSTARRPGETASTSYYYDRLECPVLTVYPGNQKMYTKYDILGRVIMTGVYTGTGTPSGTQALYEQKAGAPHYYTNTQAFPTSGTQIYTVNYYDGYDRDGNHADEVGYTVPPTGQTSYYPAAAHPLVRGLATGTRTAVLPADGSLPTLYLNADSYYDRRGHIIQDRADNHLNGRDLTWYQIDFAGRQLRTRRDHTATPAGGTAQVLVVNERFAYDHRGRLKNHWHRIGDSGTEMQLAEYTYDELGREITKRLARTPGGAFAQTEDRSYTINGWLSAINDINGSGTGTGADIFALKLHYDEALGGTGLSQTPQYTGNISALQWRTGTSSLRSAHTFSYDGLSRLTGAAYGDRTTTTIGTWQNAGRYAVENIQYDRNGNIQRLTRRGMLSPGTYGVIDQLSYAYDVNYHDRLSTVRDNGGSLTAGFTAPTNSLQLQSYDARGNLTAQAQRGLTAAQYNILNLPRRLTFGTAGTLDILYDAGGTKRAQTHTGGTRRDYVAGIDYLGTAVEAIYHAEGRALKVGSVWRYEYVLRDHLGNTRVVFRDDNADATPEVQSTVSAP